MILRISIYNFISVCFIYFKVMQSQTYKLTSILRMMDCSFSYDGAFKLSWTLAAFSSVLPHINTTLSNTYFNTFIFQALRVDWFEVCRR